MSIQQRNQRVQANRFSMVPRSDVPRSQFTTPTNIKTTFDAGLLVPFFIDEVLPGDVHRATAAIFARLATPLFPIMDTLRLETFFFFVPNRLVWSNWRKMMGERDNPDDSISYTTPKITCESGYNANTIGDYMGLPTVLQIVDGESYDHIALPVRGYYLIWNEWFRDQNLQDSKTINKTDSADNMTTANIAPFRRNKRHDYFTSALPWPLKGGQEVTIGGTGGGTAPVMGIALSQGADPVDGNPGGGFWQSDHTNTATPDPWPGYVTFNTNNLAIRTESNTIGSHPDIYVDLGELTGATINALRLAFQTQRLLERDARSGTRYTELLKAHFGVTPEDTRLQRPEYIGGGKTTFQTQAIPQTSEPSEASPLGALGATATAADQHRYSYTATEHGFIIGLVNVNAELTYQQGLHKMWSRFTRYDQYWPVFAHLGEQAILNKEIYCTGEPEDEEVFGYQERYAELRHRPSRITGLLRSTHAASIDEWHLAQHFSARPVLNSSFIEDAPPIERVIAAGDQADGMQIIMDSYFLISSTRPLPMYSVPGQIDRL